MSTSIYTNRNRIKSLAARLADYVHGKNKPGEAENKMRVTAAISEIMESLSVQEVFAVICGEFKMGKSSLINGLLELPDICPVDVDVATSVVSILRYGEKTRVIRHFGTLGGGQTEDIKLEDIPKYCVGSEEAIGKTFLIEIELPNPKLKSGLVLMDTPGVSGLEGRHGLLTSFFMPKADMVFYVFDGAPLNTVQINFLKEKILPRCRNLVFLLNRIDLLEKLEAVVADARAKLSEALGMPPEEIRIIPVSSKLKLKYLRSRSKEHLEDSNFTAFEDEIPRLLVDQERNLQLLCLKKIMLMTERLRLPLQAQSERDRKDRKAELDKLERDCKVRKDKAEELIRPDAEWRSQSRHIVQTAISAAQNRLRTENALLNQSKLNEYLKDGDYANDMEKLVRRLTADVEAAMASLDSIIDNGFSEAAQKIREIAGVELDYSVDKSSGFRLPEGRVSMPDNLGYGFFRKSWTYFRNAVIGGGVGGLLGPWGAIGGAVFGLGEAHANIKNEKARSIREALTPALIKWSGSMSEYVDNRMRQNEREMQEAIVAEAKAARAAYQEALDAFQAAAKRTETEGKALQKLIDEELRVLDAILEGSRNLDRSLTEVPAKAPVSKPG